MKKSVLFVITGLGLGGAENQLVKIALGLRKRNWEVGVYSFLKPSHFQDELEGEGIRVFSTNLAQERSPRLLQFLKIKKDLYRITSALTPDILVCFMFHAYFVGRIVGRKSHLPVISSIRTEKNEGLKKLLTRVTDWMSTVTVFNSETVAEKAISQRYVSEERSRVIPNGIEIKRFEGLNRIENRRSLSQELAIDPTDFIWVAVGRLEKPKDYPNLLKAFQLVLDNQEDSSLIIIGEGSERSNIERIVREFGISERVKLIGERRDIPELLSGSDAFVLSSSWEGLPNSLIEAIASALPAVATNVGGVREIMGVPPNCGFIVPSEEPTPLANKMMELMELSSSDRNELGTNGRDAVLERFDLERILDQYENLILEGIGESMEVL